MVNKVTFVSFTWRSPFPLNPPLFEKFATVDILVDCRVIFPGVSSTAVYCIAILASTYGFLGCIFFPKLYVIYFTPSRNSIKVWDGFVDHPLGEVHDEFCIFFPNIFSSGVHESLTRLLVKWCCLLLHLKSSIGCSANREMFL